MSSPLNFTQVCQEISNPVYEKCLSLTSSANPPLIIAQTLFFGSAALLTVWRVAHCIGTRFAKNNSPYHDYESIQSPFTDYRLAGRAKSLSTLNSADRWVVTALFLTIPLFFGVSFCLVRSLTTPDTCAVLSEKASTGCEFVLDTIASGLLNGGKAQLIHHNGSRLLQLKV